MTARLKNRMARSLLSATFMLKIQHSDFREYIAKISLLFQKFYTFFTFYYVLQLSSKQLTAHLTTEDVDRF